MGYREQLHRRIAEQVAIVHQADASGHDPNDAYATLLSLKAALYDLDFDLRELRDMRERAQDQITRFRRALANGVPVDELLADHIAWRDDLDREIRRNVEG